MSASKQRDRKCATCRHYQPSPLWRKGWCRNPLLFDPSTNHLVEADKLSCQRAFIDYWEARAETDQPLIGPVATERPRVAPSIPLMPTGPGGAPLRPPSALRAATAEALNPVRDKPPLTLVRPPPAGVEPPPPAITMPPLPRSGDTTPLAPATAAPTAAISIQGVTEPPAAPARPEPGAEQRPRLLLIGAVVLALLGLTVVLLPRLKPDLLQGLGAPTPSPTVTVALFIPPLPPTATAQPTALPTLPPLPPPPPPQLTVGGGAQVTNTGGSGLRIRQAPNTTARVLAKVPDGAHLQLKAGPQQDAAKHTWWQVTGFDNKGTLGWCVADYLKAVP